MVKFHAITTEILEMSCIVVEERECVLELMLVVLSLLRAFLVALDYLLLDK
jgi:hypothetical protein